MEGKRGRGCVLRRDVCVCSRRGGRKRQHLYKREWCNILFGNKFGICLKRACLPAARRDPRGWNIESERQEFSQIPPNDQFLTIPSSLLLPFPSPHSQSVKTKVDKAPKVNTYLLIAGGLFLSFIVSISLLVPALLFFPVTIFLGVATSFALIALAPAAFVFGWILISSAPMQDKVVVPALDKVLANKKVAKFILKE